MVADPSHLLLLKGAAATSFSPADLSGLALWLKGDAGVLTDVDGIYQWSDQSGNALHALQATGSKKPAWIASGLNGRNVVRFGGDDGLVVASLPLTSFSIFVVFKASVNGLVYEHSADASANDGAYLYTSTVNTIQRRNAGSPSSAKNRAVSWGSDGTFRRVRHDYDGTHAGHKLWIGGSDQSMTDGTGTNNPGTGTTTTSLFIGCRNQSSVFLTGDIAELLAYSPILSTENAALIDGSGQYLDTRWGV